LRTTPGRSINPVAAAFGYCAVMLAIAVPASLRRYRVRTSD